MNSATIFNKEDLLVGQTISLGTFSKEKVLNERPQRNRGVLAARHGPPNWRAEFKRAPQSQFWLVCRRFEGAILTP